MILLQRSMIAGLEAPTPAAEGLSDAVQNALQNAIELEHATIPVYLYALYSLDASVNGEIADIIQSVVVEEMLHMTLASNVLNALGGSPQIDKPGFIPTYPGPLPGGVQSELTVSLAPFSKDPEQLPSWKDYDDQLATFLQIEAPENPLEFPVARGAADTVTIGEFYAKIKEAIVRLGDEAFVKPPRNQVGPDLMDDSVVVFDVETAEKAITTIVEQGEGTTTSPEEMVGGDYAHFYRFMEIRNGRRLVRVPDADPPYAYAGDPVPFDPKGVYPVPTDPSLSPYPAGSPQAFANDNFNYTYTSLLSALHALFNGEATGDQFNRALGLMMSLKGQAKAMMSGIPDPSVHAGPTFEYQPDNPAPEAA